MTGDQPGTMKPVTQPYPHSPRSHLMIPGVMVTRNPPHRLKHMRNTPTIAAHTAMRRRPSAACYRPFTRSLLELEPHARTTQARTTQAKTQANATKLCASCCTDGAEGAQTPHPSATPPPALGRNKHSPPIQQHMLLHFSLRLGQQQCSHQQPTAWCAPQHSPLPFPASS